MPHVASCPTASLTHVEVARVAFTFWCRGNSERSVRPEIERRAETLAKTWANAAPDLRPLSSAFIGPHLAWLDWRLSAPCERLGWCGAFKLVWDSDKLNHHRGCLWPIDSYKEFIRHLTKALCQSFPERPFGDPSRLEIEPNPFLWTVAIGTQPQTDWTADNLQRYARSLVGLTIIRSHDGPVYADREIQVILDDNLAFTEQELQLMHYNTGFLYSARERLKTRHSLTYFDEAVIVPNAILRAIRSCMMKFRIELDDHARHWLEQRVAHRHPKRLIEDLVRHTHTASDILAQVEKQCFEITHEIGHRQAVFQELCERYHIAPLTDGLRQQVQQLHAQIADLTEQLQNRSLSWLKLIALVPAAYFALKMLIEYGPMLGELPWRDWLHLITG